MLDENQIPPHEDELRANDAVKFFTDVYDANGNYLTKSQKRTKIKNLMEELYLSKDKNQTTLQNGQTVPLIVARRHPGRATYYYFNTHNAPRDEILSSFAQKTNISYLHTKPQVQTQGELIAQDVLQFLDDVKVDDKYQKATGTEKRAQVIVLFQQLYRNKQKNVCHLENGEDIPIIIKKTGLNNHIAYYLNSSVYRKEVLRAFAKATDCIYLEYKENDTIPEVKHKEELTARQCARLFHKVGFIPDNEAKYEGKERILQWFHRIYSKPEQNKVKLPDGAEVPLLVRRLSHSQRCLCLNTSNASVKPFVLKRFNELSQSEFCFDNLTFSKEENKELHSTIFKLAKIYQKTEDIREKEFFHRYAERAFESLNIKTPHITVKDYLISLAQTTKQ